MEKLYQKYKKMFDDYKINNRLRLAHFFAQISHESGNAKFMEENLNYSADGLIKVFGKYFTKEQALKYARKPIDIASRVYANRMGNGDERSQDGWKYKARGFIQITGKDNYKKMSELTGINFIDNPELLKKEEYALLTAILFWNINNLNVLADKNDITMITRRINGGFNGLEERKKLFDKFYTIFKNH